MSGMFEPSGSTPHVSSLVHILGITTMVTTYGLDGSVIEPNQTTKKATPKAQSRSFSFLWGLLFELLQLQKIKTKDQESKRVGENFSVV